MKKYISNIIELIAIFLAVLSVIGIIVCIKEAQEAGRGYYTRNPTAELLWSIGAIQCVLSFFGSFVLIGFSYIVEAACRYLDKCGNDDAEQTEE